MAILCPIPMKPKLVVATLSPLPMKPKLVVATLSPLPTKGSSINYVNKIGGRGFGKV